MYFDYYYLILVVPALIISSLAQIFVKSSFAKYSKKMSQRNITGTQAAAYLLKVNGITDVKLGRIKGNLTDHFSPSEKVLRLSDSTFDSTSIAAIGVAAHETGHAIQHAKKYFPLTFRNMLVPVANIGSSAGPWLAILGIAMSFPILTDIGILLFAGSVAFYVITLPVEFNASNRAIKILKQNNILSAEELKGVKKVLSAAAMTYVGSALVAMANLLRLILVSKNRKR
ncbi:MAG: zinc metallopeptidase [Treponema sp.]|jgi:Zn-dependent membrane protease YugP|nr:zinc metallopeptidase [Treponema sp.]MBQ5847717.1 zinc metallopeptidase [Treponema sp.]